MMKWPPDQISGYLQLSAFPIKHFWILRRGNSGATGATEREKEPRKRGEEIPEKRPPQAVKLYGSNDGKVASES
jgi:hypothetical protein